MLFFFLFFQFSLVEKRRVEWKQRRIKISPVDFLIQTKRAAIVKTPFFYLNIVATSIGENEKKNKRVTYTDNLFLQKLNHFTIQTGTLTKLFIVLDIFE